MANTYTKIHVHIVFTVQNRECLIGTSWCDDLYRYIIGICSNYKHKVLAINGMPDHVHILIGMRPNQSLSELMQNVKAYSTKWINENGYVRGRFSWQEGFGAFSICASEVKTVVEYIMNQYEHHQKKTFSNEYRELLNSFKVDYDERYLFKPVI